MLRVSDNPIPRWPVDRSLSDDLGNWWVARVKPRTEKALARELREKGIGYCLPMFTKRTIRRDNHKPRKSVIPLFPGYISLTHWPEKRESILRTGRVLRVIRVIDQEKFVGELENIAKALEHAAEISIHPQLVAGKRVTIGQGPMQGVTGVIARVEEPNKIYLNVEMFNRSLAVTVPAELLIPADDRLVIKSGGGDDQEDRGYELPN
jgi:transcription antitermination factor NusG